MAGAFKQFSLGRNRKKRQLPQQHTEAYSKAKGIRSTARWQKLRRLYLRRNPVCQDCGKAAAKEVHHIEGVVDHPELAYCWENLRALCVPCHNKRDAENAKRKRETKEDNKP